jgi:hypothetical protein
MMQLLKYTCAYPAHSPDRRTRTIHVSVFFCPLERVFPPHRDPAHKFGWLVEEQYEFEGQVVARDPLAGVFKSASFSLLAETKITRRAEMEGIHFLSEMDGWERIAALKTFDLCADPQFLRYSDELDELPGNPEKYLKELMPLISGRALRGHWETLEVSDEFLGYMDEYLFHRKKKGGLLARIFGLLRNKQA